MIDHIGLLSIGDRIPCRRFIEIHSVFEQVVNFTWEDMVISICTPKLYPGPYHLIVTGIQPNRIKSVEISSHSILLQTEANTEGVLLSIEPELIYHSAWEAENIHKQSLNDNLAFIRKYLLTTLENRSLSFLLESHSGSDFVMSGRNSDLSAFEQAYRSKFRELLAQLRLKPIPENVLAFHGYGYGLTPSGDDFIIGYMLGIQILTALGKNELSKQIDFLYSGMFRYSSQKLVNTYIRMVYEGNLTEPWKQLVEAMVNTDLRNREALLQAVLNIGETSGADTMVGLITALELLF